MKLRHKILTATFLILVFLIIPVFGTGAMWIRHVGLLPSTAVVFSSDTPAIDRFMAAALKPYYGDRLGICNGVNDHVEIQAALDAVRDVKLSVGQFNCEVAIDIDNSYQTLRGCGRNTILTTTTANLDILTATGGDGTEKVGITIADLCVHGTAGGTNSDMGILLTYVDYSIVTHVWSIDNGENGIRLINSDYNTVSNSFCINNTCPGIELNTADHNTVEGNICENNSDGVYLDTSDNNTITGNILSENETSGLETSAALYNTISSNILENNTSNGMYLIDSHHSEVIGNHCNGSGMVGYDIEASDHCVITGNTAYNNGRVGLYPYYSTDVTVVGNTAVGNGWHGILVEGCDNSVISNNQCTENSQATDSTYDDIQLDASNYNTIQGNLCRAGGQTNKPKYGIHIVAGCIQNHLVGNDLLDDGFGTSALNDLGTLTHVEDNNRGISLRQIKHFRLVYNHLGPNPMQVGEVVVLKPVGLGYCITAPAAIGDRAVFGMAAEQIARNTWGLVQVKGLTEALLATNAGGGNIVIGDNLITENGSRARKAAAATDPIFARALGACAAADCTIDAYIMSPWD